MPSLAGPPQSAQTKLHSCANRPSLSDIPTPPLPRPPHVSTNQGAKVTFAFSPEQTAEKPFKGPTLLATLLYLACFALAVPACGMSRRFFSRRRRSLSGSLGANSGSLSDGNGAKRRGWRAPVGKGGVRTGGRDGEDVQEMVPLAGEDEGEWGRRERARV